MTSRTSSIHREAEFWWEVMPALPEGPTVQEHFALRRVWGDHTMNTEAKGRGFYRWGSEDNVTPALFQLWALFDDPSAFAELLAAVGMPTRNLRSVRWAYACEEQVGRGTFPGVKGNFVIPDVVVHLEDAHGPAIVAFEVKRPGTMPTPKDALKLEAYAHLPSMRGTPRTAGCFLVCEKAAPAAAALTSGATVLTWERMRSLLLNAVDARLGTLGEAYLVRAWVDRAFSRYGISGAPAPAPQGGGESPYGTSASYQAIDALRLPPNVARFLKGSEAVEAFWRGNVAEPPMTWLRDAPTRRELSARRHQQTSDRQINRWSPKWSPAVERAVP